MPLVVVQRRYIFQPSLFFFGLIYAKIQRQPLWENTEINKIKARATALKAHQKQIIAFRRWCSFSIKVKCSRKSRCVIRVLR